MEHATEVRGGAVVNDSEKPVSNLLFDWLSVLHNKAKGLAAYDQYIRDAEAANAKECVELFQRLRDADRRQAQEIKRHLQNLLAYEGGERHSDEFRGAESFSSARGRLDSQDMEISESPVPMH